MPLFCASLLSELRAGEGCEGRSGQPLELVEKKHPAVKRLTSCRERRIKEDFMRSDVGASFGVFGNLLERTVKNGAVFPQGLFRDFENSADD